MKLQQQSLKIDLNYSFGKSLVLRFMDTKSHKSLQNEVFQVFWKINTQNFSDFLHKIIAAYKLKINFTEMFWENSCFEVFVSKSAKMNKKWGFLGIKKNHCMKFFLFLAWRYIGKKILC